jgi:hypothetical protein
MPLGDIRSLRYVYAQIHCDSESLSGDRSFRNRITY